LALTDLHVYYGDAHVLHGIDLTVAAGESVCVMGPNGAGKSTLLKAIAGAVAPRTGTITLDGDRISGRGERCAVAAGISLVPEGRHIFQAMTIEDNLRIGAHSRSGKAAIEQDIALMYDIFPILGERRRHLGKAMSGGQQQMLAIARGLMSRPRVLLLDEPSLGLAPIVVHELPGVLRRVRELFEVAVLVVEQNASLALAVASRGVIMETGRIHIAGTADELRAVVARDGLFAASGGDERIPASSGHHAKGGTE
jgi:branched-chain amino acid transport system ATP-binding protein